MNELLPILSDIPLPKRSRGTSLMRPRKYPFEQMEVGQMFFIHDKEKNTLNTYFSNVGKKIGRKFSSRMLYMRQTEAGWTPCEPGDEGAVYGIGVWRTE